MRESATHCCPGPLQQQQQQQQRRRQHASSDATSAAQGCLGPNPQQQQQQQQRRQQQCALPAPASCSDRGRYGRQCMTAAGCRPLALQLLLLLTCLLVLSLLQPAAAAPSPAPAGTPATAAAVIAAAPPDVPRLELQKWNQAFRMYVSLITLAQQQEYEIINMDKCSSEGFDSTDPASVPLEACFYKQYSNGSYAYWIKKPGDWRANSNCYCYALNVYKGGFCIPGANNILSSGSASPSVTPSCEVMRAAALADGARLVPRQIALSTQPATGHYIGLLARNSSCNPYHCWREDFHAIRKDATGLWSWKEPGGPASDVDLFGNKISDPQNAKLLGNYDQWCGFFWVDASNMSIGGNFREDYKVATMANHYEQLLGAPVTLTPSPYNQTVDGAFDTWAAKGYADDLLWESKRGTRNWDAFYASGGSAPPLNPNIALQGGPAGAAAAAAAAAQRNVGGPQNVPAGPPPTARTNMGLLAQPVMQPRTNLPAAAAAAVPVPRTNMGGSGAVKPSSSSAPNGQPVAAAAAAALQSAPTGSRSSSSSDLQFASVTSPPPAAAGRSRPSSSSSSSTNGASSTPSSRASASRGAAAAAAAPAAVAAPNRVYSRAAPLQGAASSGPAARGGAGGSNAAASRVGSRRLFLLQQHE